MKTKPVVSLIFFFFNTTKIRKYGMISPTLSPNITSDKLLNTSGILLAALNWLTVMICICTINTGEREHRHPLLHNFLLSLI